MASTKTFVNCEKIDILFFDIPYSNLRRFGNEISKHLKAIEGNVSIGGIFCKAPPKNYDGCVFDSLFLRKDIKNIDLFFEKYHVQMLVLTNPRVPDQELMLHAKKHHIKIVMLQEGIIFKGTNINDVSTKNILSIFGKISSLAKTLKYLKILHRMCKYDKKSYIGLLKKILSEKINITLITAEYFSEKLNANFMYTMGHYWDSYFIDSLGYSESQLVLIGDHDLDGFEEPRKIENAICYVANVLVEDGTIKKKDFLEFVGFLEKSIDKTTKLYVKLHPRSDIKLYKALNDHNVTFLRHEALPNVKVYIGHRSTLLGRALYISDQLMLWRFKSEDICFYEKFASAVCTNMAELASAIDNSISKEHSNEKRIIIEDYYWWNKNGAFNTCAKHIHAYLKGEISSEK
ncbi:MAG: polysialyltransferase family glycosyltransferase [Bacilli bacterium]